MTVFGYARVSTEEQHTHAQTDALSRAGVEVVFQEKRSGGDRRRPELAKLLEQLRAGDSVVVYKLDRIARSLAHLLEILAKIEAAGASFRSLTEFIDTASPAGRLMMHMMGAFAEFERELIRERTRVGMRAAMERGAPVGRPRALAPETELAVVVRWMAGGVSLSALAREHGCHLSSIKRAVRRQAGPGQ
jgi:DNA invertase Pin-like site-specific DNA recombinase